MIKQYILTFEAIAEVRAELARVEATGDNIAALEVYGRLVSLYASIDANLLVSELRQVDNVIEVDFQAKRKAA